MFNKPPVNHSALHTRQVLMYRVCQIVGLTNYDFSYNNYFYSIVMKQNKIAQSGQQTESAGSK